MPEHTVQQGESIISLSEEHGVPVEKIWNDPHNTSLRSRSRETAILAPGDRIYIPEIQVKEVSAATDRRHRFRCRSRTAQLTVRFLRGDEPRAGERYVLTAGGQHTQGELDSDGWLRARVPADAHEAVVLLGVGSRRERHEFGIGHLDPVDETRGVQQRLVNLGFPCGEEVETGEVGPKSQAALRAFQQKHGIETTGRIDEATKGRLREIHGS
jgi:hypothetical protein